MTPTLSFFIGFAAAFGLSGMMLLGLIWIAPVREGH